MVFSRLSGWFKLLLLITVAWVIGVFIYVGPLDQSPETIVRWEDFTKFDYINWKNFALIGILPVVVVWGTIWVVHGFRDTRNQSNQEDPKERQKELDKKALF